jgi:hypothetical protein
MSAQEERAADELLRRVGEELERSHGALADQSEALLRWLAADLRAGLAGAEREHDERAAIEFASRIRAVQEARSTSAHLPSHSLRQIEAVMVLPVSQAISVARRSGCAPVLDLAVAAGDARELWDEPCEYWLELSAEAPRGKLMAVGVRGDSMQPVLARRDVILVQLDATPAVDDLVLARVASDGYVVKRLAALSPERVELASLNPGYDPIIARSDDVTLLGVVIARVSRRE